MELSASEHHAPVGFAGSGEPPRVRCSQHGDLVWADSAGGDLRAGRPAGRRRAGGRTDGAHCQVMADGRVLAGRCVNPSRVLADGRLGPTEHRRRTDGTSGVSEIVEVRS
jgi:hypothetical protein